MELDEEAGGDPDNLALRMEFCSCFVCCVKHGNEMDLHHWSFIEKC